MWGKMKSVEREGYTLKWQQRTIQEGLVKYKDEDALFRLSLSITNSTNNLTTTQTKFEHRHIIYWWKDRTLACATAARWTWGLRGTKGERRRYQRYPRHSKTQPSWIDCHFILVSPGTTQRPPASTPTYSIQTKLIRCPDSSPHPIHLQRRLTYMRRCHPCDIRYPSPAPPKPKWKGHKLEPDCCKVDVAKEEESLQFALDLALNAKERGWWGQSR